MGLIVKTPANEDVKKALFHGARSYNRWATTEVTGQELREVFDLMKWGPTSANSSPARFVFVRSGEAKARLVRCVSAKNQVKIEQAPVTVIIGMDERFADRLPFLFPHAPEARHWFGDDELARVTALRNSSLQGAYFILAARLVGLDCGPISGFDHALVDQEFFKGSSVRSNFLCALGHGTEEALYPRSPRFEFDEVCTFA
jgi:3-hydroxypropanoate dehydrogenase